MVFLYRRFQLFQLCLFLFLRCRGVVVAGEHLDDPQVVPRSQKIADPTLPERPEVDLSWG
jgi:hypothetical protein